MKNDEVFLFCLPGTNSLGPAVWSTAAAEYVNERKADCQGSLSKPGWPVWSGGLRSKTWGSLKHSQAQAEMGTWAKAHLGHLQCDKMAGCGLGQAGCHDREIRSWPRGSLRISELGRRGRRAQQLALLPVDACILCCPRPGASPAGRPTVLRRVTRYYKFPESSNKAKFLGEQWKEFSPCREGIQDKKW